MENKDFTYFDSLGTEHTVSIDEKDLKIVPKEKQIHDRKMQTKPTTFFKDAIRRFSKNKSSIAGAIVLGVLVLGAIILPAAIPYGVSSNDNFPTETFLEPKLFAAGTGWWDGTTTITRVYNTDADMPAEYEDKGDSILSMSEPVEGTSNAVNKYAKGGNMVLTANSEDTDSSVLTSVSLGSYDLAANPLSFTAETSEIPEDYAGGVQGEYGIFLVASNGDDTIEVPVKDYSYEVGTYSISAEDVAKGFAVNTLTDLHIEFRLKANAAYDGALFVKKAVLSTTSGNATVAAALTKVSCTDANQSLYAKSEVASQWRGSPHDANLYGASIKYVTFVFDTYNNAYGLQKGYTVAESDLTNYINKGWMSLDIAAFKASDRGDAARKALIDSFTILDDANCPIRAIEDFSVTGRKGVYYFSYICTVSKYRMLGYTSMPLHLFGTDSLGRDLLKLSFAGLRTSLLMGVATMLITFSFGLVWGAIAGYFGGWTDILMERFTEILGSLPWIVIMTIFIIKWGNNFGVFVMALCITGWIGTAGVTRTQFYRFKDREYVFAARTLGASDMRLIFRHIFPNAIGTIITSSVLMIPSVIFSEATISYLGLGLTGLSSFGVTLSENQKYLGTHPVLIIFPSAIMALMMISFNLFGNGLRDAFNPSLKGED